MVGSAGGEAGSGAWQTRRADAARSAARATPPTPPQAHTPDAASPVARGIAGAPPPTGPSTTSRRHSTAALAFIRRSLTPRATARAAAAREAEA